MIGWLQTEGAQWEPSSREWLYRRCVCLQSVPDSAARAHMSVYRVSTAGMSMGRDLQHIHQMHSYERPWINRRLVTSTHNSADTLDPSKAASTFHKGSHVCAMSHVVKCCVVCMPAQLQMALVQSLSPPGEGPRQHLEHQRTLHPLCGKAADSMLR